MRDFSLLSNVYKVIYINMARLEAFLPQLRSLLAATFSLACELSISLAFFLCHVFSNRFNITEHCVVFGSDAPSGSGSRFGFWLCWQRYFSAFQVAGQ